jgi:pyridoxal phosphate enzyme (YggS family)
MSEASPTTVSSAFAAIRCRIAAAPRRLHPPEGPAPVTLVAVSKTQPSEAITAALATGQRVFGENRVQEAQERWTTLRAEHPDLELRLIGPLQTNKARDAVALFDVIETLDRPRLADALADAQGKLGRTVPCLIQVNTGAEAQKAGVLALEAEALLRHAREVSGLTVTGLMCIPPAEELPGPHFGLLWRMARDLGLGTLSMGMSADFETAIGFGATHVRVGSALFGPRA